MGDIRRENTPVAQLNIGMYVCELDRPWLGTPFLLEGLLIEEDAELETLAKICTFVYVDRTLSVGEYFIAPPKAAVAIKRDGAVVRVNTHQQATQAKKQNAAALNNSTPAAKFSFFDVLKEIKESNQLGRAADLQNLSKTTANHPASNNTANSTNTVPQALRTNIDAPTPSPESSSIAAQIKTDLSNFLSGLGQWGTRNKSANNKLGSSINKAALKADIANQPVYANDDRITIFDDAPPVEEEIAKIYPAYAQSQLATKAIFEALAKDQKIDLTNVNEALNSMVESVERNPDALIWLAKLKQTDDSAYNHALNVSIMLMALGNFMALPKKQIKDLGLAGLLQDIGKAKMPQELLQKQEKITDDEYATLKSHVDHALALLEVTENISGTVILTVSQHHERIDGTGYPYKLKGKQISLTGQMAGLIDTYCALTTNKVYAKGVYNQVALEEIHTLRDIKFNGTLIDQLVQLLGIYPVSSLVELNSGEVGVVIQQNSVRRLQPRVMILLNPDKTKNLYPATVDLIHAPLTPTGEPYKIVKGLAPDSYDLDANNYYG